MILLRVERSNAVHSLWDGRVLVRRGTENQPLHGNEFEQLLTNRPTVDFELQEVPGANRDDLDEDVIDDYLERRQKRNPRSEVILPKDKLLQHIGAHDPGAQADGERAAPLWQRTPVLSAP